MVGLCGPFRRRNERGGGDTRVAVLAGFIREAGYAPVDGPLQLDLPITGKEPHEKRGLCLRSTVEGDIYDGEKHRLIAHHS